MKIFVTGASGYIGSKLSLRLADKGHEIHALIRHPNAVKWIQHPNIHSYIGDVSDIESVRKAMQGCTQVYHVAGKAGVWAKDPAVFYIVNVEGTRNILDAAREYGITKIVYTSSCGVLGPARGIPQAEDDPRHVDFSIDYDRSKKMAEDLIRQYVAAGMNIVIVSPAKVFGPGHISHSLMMNAMVERFLKKKLTFIPAPGTYRVGFASVDDIVTGHILAMEKGLTGETYILGGTNITHFEFFDRLRRLASIQARIILLPKMFIKVWAYLQMLSHRLCGTRVMVTPASVDHLFSDYIYSSEKAIRELGYRITPLDDVLQQTIRSLSKENENRSSP